jgi:N-methylhydantoinase A
MGWRVAVDIGGAFTDLLAINNNTKEQRWIKVESTPDNYSKGVMNALDESAIKLKDIDVFIHGQTVVINTIITKEGAKVGLITTNNFDTVEIGRANRRDIFNLKYRKPDQLIPRELIVGVKERSLTNGEIDSSINEYEIKEAIRQLINKDMETCVIGFINSYSNPENEKKAGEIVIDEIEKLNRVPFITLSHELTREWREYERISTAILNAYVQPRFNSYLNELEKEMNDKQFKGTFYVMLANSGMSLTNFAKKYPIYAIEGGPVAGVVGGIIIGESIKIKDAMVLDGGSTTTKASLIKNLQPKITTEYYVNRDRTNPGYPVRVPVVETIEIGNGGTSIIWIDNIGRLKVGPKSAGSEPGPACYDKGGKEPTLTDAYVIAGYLNPDHLLGGDLKIKKELSKESLKDIAQRFNVSIEEVADAAIRIANDQAAHVIKSISIQEGYDPRESTLIAHGGSGPMFAPFIADELQISKVIIPAIPAGVFNSWGMLTADIRHEIVHTNIIKISDLKQNSVILNKTYLELEDNIFETFKAENIEKEKVKISRYADIRYYGQEHTIKIPVNNKDFNEKQVKNIESQFIEKHNKEYDFKLPDNPVEIVNLHSIGEFKVEKPSLQITTEKNKTLKQAYLGEREVYLSKYNEFRRIPIYKREKLPQRTLIKGPIIIEENTSTIVVTEQFSAKLDKYGNIIIEWND